MFSGSEPKIISRPMQPFIDRINWSNKANICGGIDGDHVLYYIGTLTSALPGDSAALTNVILDYDLSQNLWTYHVVPDTIRAFSVITSSGSKVLSIGDANGEVFTWGSGSTDDGTAIATNIELVMWPSGPETMDTLQQIHFFGNEYLGLVDWQFKVDGGSYSTAVDLTNNYSKKFFADASIDPYGRELGLKFSESGGANQWRLDGFSIETETGGLEIAES
jgi:hypothetical protein